MPAPKENLIRALKVLVFLLGLGPVAVLTWKGFHDLLGANPIDVITRTTGRWTLIYLLVTLAITPLRRLSAMPWLIRSGEWLASTPFSTAACT